MDVNNDKVVTPQDVLIVINDLNARGGRNLPYITSPPQYFLDVNRDNALSPADALQIINHLNSRSGEGESRVSGWIELQRTAPTTAAMPETLEDEPAEALFPFRRSQRRIRTQLRSMRCSPCWTRRMRTRHRSDPISLEL